MILFIIPFVVTLLSEGTKVLVKSIQSKRFRGDWFLHSGGFPSSHASFSSSVCTIIFILEGAKSPIALLSTGWMLLVLYDARGVRNTVSKHAEALNELLHTKQFDESIGHSNTEVIAGCSFGILTSLFLLYLLGRLNLL